MQPVQTLEELLTLPKAHIATVLAAVLKIFRQKRKIDGKRYTNVSLKLKVEAWQRIIRGHFQTQYNRSVISNPTVKAKTFNMYTEPELAILTTTLDQEMRTSAALGLSSGMVKRRRSLVTPADLKKILQLWDLSKPEDVELVFAITIMINLGPRGARN